MKDAVLQRLCASGRAFEAVPDLCGLAASRDPRLAEWAGADELTILACYPRAVRWLFAVGGAPLPEEGVRIVNLRDEGEVGTGMSLLQAANGQAGGRPDPAELKMRLEADPPDKWVPWFPVVDYDRCQGCKQCYSFCLFGVYQLSEDGRVEVRNPARCKTNCPACARICPQAAIMFPKYGTGPIAGEQPGEAPLAAEPMRVDLSALAGEEVMARLRERGRVKGARTGGRA